MHYLEFLYCHACARTSTQFQFFDSDKKKPCYGTCGHSICLECFEKNSNKNCPICRKANAFEEKTVNFALINSIEDCWNILKAWWNGTVERKIDCSKCEDKARIPRICMSCDGFRLCEKTNESLRLRMRFDTHMYTLASHVLCGDCIEKYHHDHKDKQMRVRDIEFAEEEIKMTTSSIIMKIFKRRIDRESISCHLQLLRIEITEKSLRNLIEGTYRPENDSCGQLLKEIRLELFRKRMRNLEKQLQSFFETEPSKRSKCECTRILEKSNQMDRSESVKTIYGLLATRSIGSNNLGCPLYFKFNETERQILLSELKEEEILPEEPTSAENNQLQCCLCDVFNSRNVETEQQLEYYNDNCLDIFENWWKSEMPLNSICLQCLTFLNHFSVGISCRMKLKQNKFDKLDRWEETVLLFPDYEKTDTSHKTQNGCITKNCSLKNPNYWKFMIKRGTLTYASSMLKKGLNEAIGVVDCKLRKMRMIKTGKRLVHTICEIGMNNLSKWNEKEVSEIMEKIENLIEKLKFQWKEYRYGNGETSETFEVIKCECTILWEKEDPKLKKSLKEISEFSSFDLISGCPLNYKHSIKLKFSGKVK